MFTPLLAVAEYSSVQGLYVYIYYYYPHRHCVDLLPAVRGVDLSEWVNVFVCVCVLVCGYTRIAFGFPFTDL